MGLGFEVLGFRVQGSTLSGIDERTKVSREVTDEEILEYSRSVKTPKAIPGHKFRTNQLISKLMHGA